MLGVREGELAALFVRRPGNRWGLPGGAVEASEALDDAAEAALAAQAGATAGLVEQLYTFGAAGEDIRVTYLALGTPDRSPIAPGPGVVEVRWVGLADPPPVSDADRQAVSVARERLRGKAAYAPIALAMLPESFTLGELQTVYEAALGVDLDTRNFRRDVLASGLVEPSGGTRASGPGRPARLYQAGTGSLAIGERERRLAGSLSPAEWRGREG
jgi:8-oxo-dGTP diphosphatase